MSTRRFSTILSSRRQIIWFALGAAALSLVTYWYHPVWLESFDQRGRDMVFQLRPAPVPPQDVAVVVVDERSIKEYGRWPWPRPVQAQLIQTLASAGTATIALDIVYAQPLQQTCDCPSAGLDLSEVLAATTVPVVGGFFLRNERSTAGDPAALRLAREQRIKNLLLSPGGHLNSVPVYPHMELNQADIARHFAAMGVFNRSTDADGLVRTAPLVLAYQPSAAGDDSPAGAPAATAVDFMPALSLQALAVYRGERPGLIAGRDGLSAVKLGALAIPVDAQGRMAVDFYRLRSVAAGAGAAAADDGLALYSAADVLAGAFTPAAFNGRLVFVGVSEIGIADLLPTPVDPLFPGVALHATAAANILHGQHLYRNLDTVLIDVAMIALIPLALVVTMAQLRRLWVMGAAFVLFGMLLFGVFYYLVAWQHHLVSLVYPTAAVATAFVAFQVYYILTAQRTTRFLTNAFSSYVAPELVQRLLEQPQRLGLSGEKREITVLFSDIRGFTSMAEQLEPEALVALLNDLLGRLSAAILDRSGTLDKYIGDAIMALFNAPLNIEHHASKAAAAALAMQQICAQLDAEYAARYPVRIRIGIGLHCGEAIVGNLGSERRFDYTAIGDTVNLASRVESISKFYGVDIVVTQAMVDQLQPGFLLRPLDELRVKGKTVPVTIYELMPATDEGEALRDLFVRALTDYRQQDFAAALVRFEAVLQRFPDDQPAQIYVERCTAYCRQPPPAEWDGVFQALEK